jgi:hypothetical protein
MWHYLVLLTNYKVLIVFPYTAHELYTSSPEKAIINTEFVLSSWHTLQLYNETAWLMLYLT